jgi:hypothetical protein
MRANVARLDFANTGAFDATVALGRFQYRLRVTLVNPQSSVTQFFVGANFIPAWQSLALQMTQSANLRRVRSGQELQVTLTRDGDPNAPVNSPFISVTLSAVDNFDGPVHDEL